MPIRDEANLETMAGRALEINRLHHLCQALWQEAMRRSLEIGEKLAAVRNEVPHSRWNSWVAANLAFTVRMASYYIVLHENRELVGAGMETGQITSIRSALKAIQDASPPANRKRASDLEAVEDELSAADDLANEETDDDEDEVVHSSKNSSTGREPSEQRAARLQQHEEQVLQHDREEREMDKQQYDEDKLENASLHFHRGVRNCFSGGETAEQAGQRFKAALAAIVAKRQESEERQKAAG